MVDQKHKTLRSFYCEDALWEMFEVMTRDLDCSMDYLINESMRHYARSRNYSLTGMSRLRQPEPNHPGYGYGQPAPTRVPEPLPPQRDARTVPLPAYEPPPQPRAEWDERGYYRPQNSPRLPPPPPREIPPPPRPPVRRPEPMRQPPAPPVAPVAQPRPRRPTAPAPVPARALSDRPAIFMFFNGQRYAIDKDRYIIGRGSQSTDLTIRDGNISRKHAAVIYHDGAYYIQDLGSTNGVEYRNAKVASKQIEEGDVFNICDYELRFSYVG
jgi:hypothetical protein